MSCGAVPDMPVSRIREAEMLTESNSAHELQFYDHKVDMSQYYQAAKEQMEQLVQWAKHVPRFNELQLKDQLTLLKTGTWSCTDHENKNSIVFLFQDGMSS